jgi:hypothetical protein
MPRLSLYKPEKGNDYKFIDRQASEMFQAGGTDIYLHKYLGPNIAHTAGTADQPTYGSQSVTNIQDLLFLENRDRKYDTEIYRLRGMYNVANIDFNLSQFGLFIDNDTMYMTVHINDFIKYIGRKPISGDVFELPHLRDEFALNDFDMALPRYYVIEDVGRASEGFSVTWYPHLYRLKCKKITDNQQFAEIFNQPAKDANGDDIAGTSLKDLLSTYNREIEINNQVLAQAEADAPKSGYETRQFYTLAVDDQGRPTLETADETTVDASSSGSNINASSVEGVPPRTGYTGYLVGDGFPQNGYDFGFGIQFPNAPAKDDFFLRTDFLPNRLFRFDAVRWVKVEDSVRMNMTNNDSRSTLKTGFINNSNKTFSDQVATGWSHNPTPVPGEPAGYIHRGDVAVFTLMTYTSASYVLLKLDTVKLDFDNSTIVDNAGKIKIVLPTVVAGDLLLGATYKILTVGTTDFTKYGAKNNSIGTVFVATGTGLGSGTAKRAIPNDGVWEVTLYNNYEPERQALSKVLRRPEVDF